MRPITRCCDWAHLREQSYDEIGLPRSLGRWGKLKETVVSTKGAYLKRNCHPMEAATQVASADPLSNAAARAPS